MLLEAGSLVQGVVQLRKGVGQFLAGYEELEPLSQFGVFPVCLGQGAQLLRVIGYESRLLKAVLYQAFEELVQEFAPACSLQLRQPQLLRSVPQLLLG